MVIINVKTTIHFLKVTPLIWASVGQNRDSKTNNVSQLFGGEVWFGKCHKFCSFYFLKVSLTSLIAMNIAYGVTDHLAKVLGTITANACTILGETFY